MQNLTPMAERRTYTKEFKLEALRLAKEHRIAQTARDLDINENMIYRWRERYAQDTERAFPSSGDPGSPEVVLKNWTSA